MARPDAPAVAAPAHPLAKEIVASERARPLLTADHIGVARKRALLEALLSDLICECSLLAVPATGAPRGPEDLREGLPLPSGVRPDIEDTNLLGPGRHAPRGPRLKTGPEMQAEIEELRTVLSAWHNQFGTTQLTHAIAKFEALADEVRRLKAELAPLRETVGVRADSASTPDDLANWSKLMARADRTHVAEAAVSLLRRAVECFANPDYWRDLQPGLQWFGKRNPMDFAKSVLADTARLEAGETSASQRFVVEGLDAYGRWSLWGVWDERKEKNPCSTLEEALALKSELDEWRLSARTGWKDSRIVVETTVRTVLPS